jgi:hypothetical protein
MEHPARRGILVVELIGLLPVHFVTHIIVLGLVKSISEGTIKRTSLQLLDAFVLPLPE